MLNLQSRISEVLDPIKKGIGFRSNSLPHGLAKLSPNDSISLVVMPRPFMCQIADEHQKPVCTVFAYQTCEYPAHYCVPAELSSNLHARMAGKTLTLRMIYELRPLANETIILFANSIFKFLIIQNYDKLDWSRLP